MVKDWWIWRAEHDSPMDAGTLRERAAQCRKLAHSAGAVEVAEMLRDLALDFLARAQAEERSPAEPECSRYVVRPVKSKRKGSGATS